MVQLKKHIKQFKGKRILVVGDVMLDRYLMTKPNRISDEAPVPIVAVKDERYVPGGAGNCANNLVCLGASVVLASVIGKDNAGETLTKELLDKNITPMLARADRPTTQKTRLVALNQQVARIDRETNEQIDEATESYIIEKIKELHKDIDGIVVSDYAKGTITKKIMDVLILISKEGSIPLVVDPKPKHAEWYKGATVMTPNAGEASNMANIVGKSDDDFLRIGRKISAQLETSVLLTRGAKGMSIFKVGMDYDSVVTNIPTFAREVYDVSGAGDTVVATLVLGLVTGASLEDAAILANYAAGIKVGKFGTAPVYADELETALSRGKKSKIKSREELIAICGELRKKGKTVGFTSGAFDLIHAGHVDYLEKAKQKCSILIAGINTDESVKKYKGEDRPLIPENERVKMIAGLESIDYVFLFDERRNKENILALKPDFYIKAGDYKPEELTSAKYLEPYGGEAVLIPPTEGISTSEIVAKIQGLTKKEDLAEIKSLKKHPAIFLDRDGVINEDVEYLHEPEKFKLIPGVLDGLKKMQNMGFKLIVATLQAGIGLGYFTKEDFYKINRTMFKAVGPEGIVFDKIYFCPHSLKDNCECRKPKPGMLLRGQEEENIDLSRSFMIGDKTSDIEAGKRAGVKTILVKTGKAGEDKEFDVQPDFIANNLIEAAEWIEKEEGK